MARVYSPVVDHTCDYGVDFVNGVGVVLDADTERQAYFTAKGYTVVTGADALSVWDRLPLATLQGLAPKFGINPAGKTKAQLVTAVELNMSTHLKIEITAFDAIANVSAGTVAVPLFANLAAARAALPTTVLATIGGGVAVVPVASWADTDTFNKAAAASYTFTAVLGALPVPYANTATVTATVEVVVGA